MPATKREKKSTEKKAKILHTTTRLLIKKGSSGATSTTDVCTAARLTRPTLYHYFGSKRNLLLAVHMESIATTLGPYMIEALSIDDPLKRLTYMVRAYIRNICTHPELRALIHDTLIMKDKHFREVKIVWKKHYLLLRDTLVALQSTDRIDPSIKPSWAALFVLGMLTWTTYWFDYERKDSIEQIADLAEYQVLHGLGLRKKTSAEKSRKIKHVG
jgi:TetR/AcrR family transcriptional regulator, cholesterol catabolism regulator